MDMDFTLLLLLRHGLDALRLILRLILPKQKQYFSLLKHIELDCFSIRYMNSISYLRRAWFANRISVHD
jgi:hypothetical protein